MVKRTEVVGVFLAAGDRQDRRAQYAVDAMDDTARIAWIGNAARKPRCLNGARLREKEHTTDRRELTTVEAAVTLRK